MRRHAAGEEFMRRLREDHAGLSRVLREIDAQQSALTSTPETARPVLVEAVRYLLLFQHSVHHPREDRLFERIRAREPMLYRNMKRLVHEHRVGQERVHALSRELARATPSLLRGRTGWRIARQLHDYVQHTREHMRREEAVFYTGSERVLRASDWAALTGTVMSRDPAGDLHRLATRYPRLAARLARPERMVTGGGEIESHVAEPDGLRHRVEALAERCGEIVHDTVDVAQHGVRELRRVRSPLGLVRASADFGVRSARLALRVVTLPFSS
jgi:hemerythrin-like domain-containing protein